MPAGLKRIYGRGHRHFLTFSCYKRLPFLKSLRSRDVFVQGLGRLRTELKSSERLAVEQLGAFHQGRPALLTLDSTE